MNKEEIYQYLNKQQITYEVDEHPAVFNMEELQNVKLSHMEWIAKNLFVRDDKKRNYYLLSVKDDKRVDLKAFKNNQGLRSLSFASDNDLYTYLKLIPGSVTPLGLLNDIEHKVVYYLDQDYLEGMIGIHPNDNTATIYLKTADLLKLLETSGCNVKVVKI